MKLKIMECFVGDLIKISYIKHPDIKFQIGMVVDKDEINNKIKVLLLNDNGSIIDRLTRQAFSHKCFNYYYQKEEDNFDIEIFDIVIMRGGDFMNSIIINHFPQTKDAVLVDKWFGKEIETNKLFSLLLKGKEKEILKEAQRLEDENKKSVK